MERKDFLKGLGVIGVGSMLPLSAVKAAKRGMQRVMSPSGTAVCVLVPNETAGPYPLNLSGNNAMFRNNITEGRPGLPLNLSINVVNINNGCAPIPNARIDIWHCDKDGYYSGYTNAGYLGSQNNVGQIFFRGIQLTDLNGQANFVTIYPGWYGGRAAHIHAQIFLGANAVLQATTQFAFPPAITTAVNGTSQYSTHGQNPTTNTNDNVFSDTANTNNEMLAVTANTTTGGYDATITVGIAIPAMSNCAVQPAITGNAVVTIGANNAYSVPAVSGATYNWIVNGGTIVSGARTNSIVVQWTSNSGSIEIIQTNP